VAFGCTPRGTLLSFTVMPHTYRDGFWDPNEVRESPPMVNRSEDEGRTWSGPEPIDASSIPVASKHYYGRTHALPDGTLLLNVRRCWGAHRGKLGYLLPRNCASYLIRSRDDGRTWGDASLISREDGPEGSTLGGIHIDGSLVDAAPVRLASGKLVAALSRH